MKASTAIILVVTLFAMLIAGGGGALLVASQKDRDADTALPATPVNVNNTLSREYPVETDPLVANRNCAVQNAVYKDVGPCVGEDGTVLDGTVGKCGSGTVTRKLDTEESVGFVPESGTGSCDILETTGECQVPCPVDCSGGAWIDGQSCLRTNSDGSTATLVDGGKPRDGTCGQGQMTRTRDTNTDDFVEAVGLGSCTLITSTPCSRTCENGEVIGECGYSGIKVKDRDIGSTVLGHEGCVKKDASDEPVKGDDGKYVPVEVGGTGLERWYEAAVYGDTAKCDDLVQWKTCQGPPTPVDCVGGWLDQDPNTDGTQEWSACKLPEGEVCGATYREKQYHITTPQGTRTVGEVTIENGKACSATVTVDGKDEKRTMVEGGQLTFTEWCGESKRVECCVKTDWKLDTERGCVLDEDGGNPTERLTRKVTGECGPDDAPYDEDEYGNAEEIFRDCCYFSGWSVPDGTECNTKGKMKETQDVIGKKCTPDDHSEKNKVRYTEDCCYESGWSTVANSCNSDGKEKETQTVVGLEGVCTKYQLSKSNKERWDKDCCYESGWSVVPDSCNSDGKEKEVQTVTGSECTTTQLSDANKERWQKDCCYESGWSTVANSCNSDGKEKEVQTVKGAKCSSYDLRDANKERWDKDCCYESGWSTVANSCRSDGKEKEVQTVKGAKCTSTQLSAANKERWDKDCCYESGWSVPEDAACRWDGKIKEVQTVAGTCMAAKYRPENKTRYLKDCCYVDDDDWVNSGSCTSSWGQKQTREGTGATCDSDDTIDFERWIGCCIKGDWTNDGRCGEHRRNFQKKTRTLTGSDCFKLGLNADTTYERCTEPTDCVGDWHERSTVRDERCVFFQCLDWKDATGKNGKVHTIYQEHQDCGWTGYPDCWQDTEGGYEYKINGWDESPHLLGRGKYPGTHVLDVDGTIPTAHDVSHDRNRKWPQSGEKRDNEKRKKWTKKGVVKGKQVKKDTWEVYKISTQAANGGNACPHDDGDVRNFTAGDWGPDQDGICRGEESQGTCTDDRPVCENKVQHHGTWGFLPPIDANGWEDTDSWCKGVVESGWRGCDPTIWVEDGTTWGGVKGRKQIMDSSSHSLWNKIRWKCPKSCAINPDCQMDQDTNWDDWDVKY